MYQAYPLYKIVLRRVLAVLVGILALPVMLFRQDRYLHRIWCKTSTKPVWLAQTEAIGSIHW